MNPILFDLDGTLLDTAPDLTTALNRVLVEHNLPTHKVETLRARVHGGSRTLLGFAFGLDEGDAEFEKIKHQFYDYYTQTLDQKTVFFPGTEQVLDTLDRKNIPWGIVTNKPTRFTEPLLKHLDLTHRAQAVVCGDTLPVSKPDPAPLLLAAEKMQINPRDTWFIGDAKIDMLAAKSAEMRGVIATFGYIPDNANLDRWPHKKRVAKPVDILDLD